MRRTPLHLAVVAALSIPVLLLSACGGGGGGSAPTGSTSSPTPTAPASQPTAPASAFPTATVLQQQAYAEIQSIQKAVGLTFNSQVPQDINPALETAAQNHLNYMLANKQFTSAEDLSLPDSTGKTASAQATAAGYPASGGGTGNMFGAIPPGVTGAQWVDALLSTAIGADFVLPNGEQGFAFSLYPSTGTPQMMVGDIQSGWYPTSLYAAGATGPMGQTELVTYPYNGQTNVPPTNLLPEIPGSTLPFLSPAAAESHGTPISFLVGSTTQVTLANVSLKDAQGNAVPIQVYDYSSASAQSLGFGTGMAVVVPTAPLQPNTTYTVHYGYKDTLMPGNTTLDLNNVDFKLTFTTGDQKPFQPSRPF